MNLFREVKDAVSAKDAASFYGISITKNKMCNCPFHDDRHPSMKIDRYYYCFACGAKGDSINLVAGLFGLSPIQAAKKIIRDFQLGIDPDRGPYSGPGILSREKQNQKTEQEQLRAFHLQKRDALFSLHKYYNKLHCAMRDLAPKAPGELESCDPLFLEAVTNLDRIDWMIETLETGTLEEQMEFMNTYKEEIAYAKERTIIPVSNT